MIPLIDVPRLDTGNDVVFRNQIKNYLRVFKEQVELLLSNIDSENMSQDFMTTFDRASKDMKESIVKLNGASSKITQMSNKIELKLDKDDFTKASIIAQINDSGQSSVKISADSIDVDGIFSVNDFFKAYPSPNARIEIVHPDSGRQININGTGFQFVDKNNQSIWIKDYGIYFGGDNINKVGIVASATINRQMNILAPHGLIINSAKDDGSMGNLYASLGGCDIAAEYISLDATEMDEGTVMIGTHQELYGCKWRTFDEAIQSGAKFLCTED